MKWKFFPLGMAVLLSGCLKTKTETYSSYSISNNDKITLKQECDEMSLNGDIFSLLASIRKNTDRVLQLLEQENVRLYEPEISSLANKVHQDTNKVKSLSRSEWSIGKYERSITWIVDKEDFKDHLSVKIKGLRFMEQEVFGVYLAGEKRADLEANISTTSYKDKIEVTYSTKASALELCQLEKTLMVVLEVKFKKFANPSIKYFNLIVGKK